MSHIYEIHNALTGEIIRKELTADEIATAETDRAKRKADEAKAEADKASARTALLAKLGITADEAKLLLG